MANQKPEKHALAAKQIAGKQRYFGMGSTQTGILREAQERAQTPAQAQAALGALCVQYRAPVRQFIALITHPGTFGDAEDLTQEFMAEFLHHGVDSYDRSRGRFRPWLLGMIKNFLGRKRAFVRAQCRDNRKTDSLDETTDKHRSAVEPQHSLTPERVFASAVALCAAEQAWMDTQQWYADRGKADRFAALEGYIPRSPLTELDYDAAGERLNLSQGAVRVAVHALRNRYRRILRDHISRTVPNNAEVDDELLRLVQATHQRWGDA